jgi:hypothetical protein
VQSPSKVYEPPHLRELKLEQGTLYLVGHAYIGHRGAKQLLELLFPEPTGSNVNTAGRLAVDPESHSPRR